MKYWISAEGFDQVSFAYLLAKEIFRFDVRAHINLKENSEELNRRDFSLTPDKQKAYGCFIRIGDKYINTTNQKKIRKYFISTRLSKLKAIPGIEQQYAAIPDTAFGYKGCYLSDLIKAHSFKEIKDSLENYTIGILLKNAKFRSIDKIIQKVKKNAKNLQFILPETFKYKKTNNAIIEYQPELDLLKNSSLVILDNDYNSLKATLLNCPQIRIKATSFFNKVLKQNRGMILNDLLKKNFFTDYSIHSHEQINDEVHHLLGDHKYYASFLSEYQKIRNLLGVEPTARNLAREIVDSLENPD